ncbi:immunoglobulin-like domain-containing protein [Listeria booriae]|uniref:immunoglobulin-like domain-containing protein n=1 Tax=Listeria booriae TaxID=1552123 RepID=UPI0016257328|nr:immunoglobulin-like domain-containing protein [Listeria booriae]MBC2189801.1 hypothetical protein [Listeria booriae]
MKKNTKRVLVGLLAFNVLASAPLTTISANAAEAVATKATNSAGELVKSSLKATATNLIQNSNFNFSMTTGAIDNWYYYNATDKKIVTYGSDYANLHVGNADAFAGGGPLLNLLVFKSGGIGAVAFGGNPEVKADRTFYIAQGINTIPGKAYRLKVGASRNGSQGGNDISISNDSTFTDINKVYTFGPNAEYSTTVDFIAEKEKTYIGLGNKSFSASSLNATGFVYDSPTVVQVPVAPTTSAVTSQDTSITVTGEPNARITIALPDSSEMSRVADASGKVTFTIPKQDAGEIITAVQSSDGETSSPTTLKVTLKAPSISAVDDKSISVTITGDPSSEITVNLPDGSRTTKTANAQGQVTFNVSGLVADQVIQASQSKNGQTSPLASTTVQATALNAPTIAPFTTADTQLVVTGEAGARISVKLPDGSDMNKTAGADGKATFNIGTQDLGAVIEATQTGSNGKTSASASITVTQGAIAAPAINAVTTDSTTVTGTGIAGASVKVKANNIDYTGTVKADGTYSVTIPKQAFGTIITATQTKDGITSTTATKSVAQGNVAAPTINALTTDDTTVTGTGIAGASVKVKANNIDYTGTVKADGTYSITIPKQAANAVVTATQTLNNVTSSAVSTTVTAKAVASTLTAGDFTIGADNYIKGTYTGDIAKLAIEVNGILQQTINATGSPYQYYAKGKVNAATDQVYVIGYDATGKQLQKTKVNVKQQTVGTITPNTFYIGSENYVTGKLSGNVAKFSMTVNGVEYSKINVTTAPDFKYYANNLITNITDIVKVNAYDASGKLLDSKPVSVTTYQGEEGKITSVAPFKLGKDSYVTGAYTGDVKKVELQVNGVALQRINVTGGTIKYYAKANITKTTDEVKLVGYNTAGVAVSTKTISVSAADGTVTANPFVIGKDGYVTGKYTGDVAKISLTVNGVKQTTINVPAGSDYQYYAKTLIKNASDVVVLTAYDAVGGVLDTANVAVSDSKATTSGTVTPSAFKLGTDAYVDGTYTGDVAKVELEVNDVKYGQIPATGNTIHYYAASLITKASDVVKVNVYDTAGKQLDSKTVSVVAPTGTVIATTVKVGDSYLRGTATGDVTKVALSVNGTVQTSVAFVQPDGSYQYYIKNLNLKATDDVKVIGMDARGNTINTSNVTITN